MKIGVLSDIHGNHRALEAVLSEFENANVDRIACLGDIVGYLHESRECLDTIMGSRMDVILGNHEGMLVGRLDCPPSRRGIYFLEGLRNNLQPSDKQWLLDLPTELTLDPDGRRASFFHGSPWNHLEEYIHPDSVDVERFSKFEYDYIFLGHTHYPMLVKCGQVMLINPGSCGLPRDGTWKASAAILDTETGNIRFIKAEYDVVKTINDAQSAGVAKEVIDKLLGGYTNG